MHNFAVGEAREVLTGETIMQLRQRFIGVGNGISTSSSRNSNA